MCSRFSVSAPVRFAGRLIERCNMQQQTTIRFDRSAEMPQTVDVVATLRDKVQQVYRWLDSRSGFYSRLMGETVTWRMALRAGVVLPAMMTAVVICGMQAPMVSAVCLVAAGWTVYRLNAGETGSDNQDRKGGEA